MQQLSELWIKYRLQVLMIVIAAVVWGYWILNKNNNDALISNTNAVLTSSETGSSLTSTTTMKGTVAIDIKGAVKMPGVYELKADDRVNEALKAAGGPLPNADLRQVNLAKQLMDQYRIQSQRQRQRRWPQTDSGGSDGRCCGWPRGKRCCNIRRRSRIAPSSGGELNPGRGNNRPHR